MKSIVYSSLTFVFILFSSALFAQTFSDSLLLHMPMDGSAIDISGNNNNGTIHNVVSDTNRFGVPNTCYRFNGVDSYIEIPPSPSLARIQKANIVTISAWINIYAWHSSGNVFSIFERYNPKTDAGWLLEANWAGGGILFLGDENNPSGYVGCNYTWNFHEWHLLSFTYDRLQGLAEFYVDSVKVCSKPYTAFINVSDTAAPYVIGRSLAGPDEYSNGLIDDYKIYDRVLDSSEIKHNYDGELAKIKASKPVTVFPNPATDKIEVSYGQPQVDYKIADALGRIVLSGKLVNGNKDINIASLAPGMYILHTGDQQGRSFKIIKL